LSLSPQPSHLPPVHCSLGCPGGDGTCSHPLYVVVVTDILGSAR
jgi:hypothetical protein